MPMRLENPLQGSLELALKAALDNHLHKNGEKTPPNLEESIRYSLLSPGKRIRPRLLLASSEMMGLDPQATLPAALALEMIHCFTLIHDDLPCMDDDDFRRGMPSNHKKFGEALALLAGDGLMALAVDIFLDSQIEADRLKMGLKRLTWAMGPRGVIGGQAAESLMGPGSRLEDLRWMHRQKTGALFSAALLIPKDFAGISDSSPAGQAILSFADLLGLSFQAADDLEDADQASDNSKDTYQTSGGFKDTEAHLPTSILYYLSRNEVISTTIQQLNSASQQLLHQFGEKALPLKQIADEVIKKVEITQETFSR